MGLGFDVHVLHGTPPGARPSDDQQIRITSIHVVQGRLDVRLLAQIPVGNGDGFTKLPSPGIGQAAQQTSPGKDLQDLPAGTAFQRSGNLHLLGHMEFPLGLFLAIEPQQDLIGCIGHLASLALGERLLVRGKDKLPMPLLDLFVSGAPRISFSWGTQLM